MAQAIASAQKTASPETENGLGKPRRVFIGAGSNLGDRIAHLHTAWRTLHSSPFMQLTGCSPIYCSQSLSDTAQPAFYNAVFACQTRLPPLALLQALHAVEYAAGRKREQTLAWEPRTLDLDILWFEGEKSHNTRLRLPHPGICDRLFVIQPLCDLAPYWVLPNGRTVRAHLDYLNNSLFWANSRASLRVIAPCFTQPNND